MEPYEAMERACEWTGPIVAAISASRFDDPTPCSKWDVRSVLNHVVGNIWLSEAWFAGREPAVKIVPGELPEVDVVGDDPGKAFAEGAQALLSTATTADAIGRIHATTLGELPGFVLADLTTVDIVVHGWDLATATDQDATIDDDVAEHVLAFARQAFGPDTRASYFAAELDDPGDASLTDQLVAFLGRRPVNR